MLTEGRDAVRSKRQTGDQDGARNLVQEENLTRTNFLSTGTWAAQESNRFLICPVFLLQQSPPGGLGIQRRLE